MTNIILCGGSGTRLWPLSRNLLPKQFVKLFNNRSLFSLTLERNKDFENTLIVANQSHYFLVIDALENSNASILLEPLAKNTMGAITLAIMNLDPSELVLITPSDHLVKNIPEYHASINEALELAKSGNIVLCGIRPSGAETGYGYIKHSGNNVLEFREKPDKSTAQSFLNSGNYLWNSGMLIFKVEALLNILKNISNDIFISCQNAFKNEEVEEGSHGKTIRIKKEDMEQIKEGSIDFLLLEKILRGGGGGGGG